MSGCRFSVIFIFSCPNDKSLLLTPAASGNTLNLVFRRRVKIYALNTQEGCVTRAQGFAGSPGGEAVSSICSREWRGGQERENRKGREMLGSTDAALLVHEEDGGAERAD